MTKSLEITIFDHNISNMTVPDFAFHNRLQSFSVQFGVLDHVLRIGRFCTEVVLNYLSGHQNTTSYAVDANGKRHSTKIKVISRNQRKKNAHEKSPFVRKEILTRLNLQQLNRLPQPRRCLAMVSPRHAQVREVFGVDDLRLVAGVAEPVALAVNLGNAAHEVAVRIARLPVLGVVDGDNRADAPVEVTAFSGLLHRSGVQLSQQKLFAWPANINQHVAVLAERAREIEAVLVDLRLGLLELKFGLALLALNHGVLRVNRRIVA